MITAGSVLVARKDFYFHHSFSYFDGIEIVVSASPNSFLRVARKRLRIFIRSSCFSTPKNVVDYALRHDYRIYSMSQDNDCIVRLEQRKKERGRETERKARFIPSLMACLA